MRGSTTPEPPPSNCLFAGLSLFLTVANRSSHLNHLRQSSTQQRSLIEARVTLRTQNPYPIVLSEPGSFRK